MEHACAAVRQWLEFARERLQSEAMAAATAAVEALEARAMGGQNGLSWRQALSAEASWDEVEREAAYHLFPPNQPSTQEELERLHGAAQKTLEDLFAAAAQLGDAPDKDFVARVHNAILRARVTCTESYFVKAVTEETLDRRGSRVRHRIMSMAKYGIEEELLHPTVWERAKAAAAV